MRSQSDSAKMVIMLISVALIFTASGFLQHVKGDEQPQPNPDIAALKQAFADLKQSETNNEEAISTVSLTATPIGSVSAYSGLIDGTHILPPDWLACDGKAGSSSDYPTLFAALGTAYGDGRDAQGNKVPGTNFNVPDLRGYFLRGVDGNANRDPDAQLRSTPPNGVAGALVGSVKGDAFKSHSHLVNDPGHTHTLPRGFLGNAPGGYQVGGGNGGSDIYDSNLQTVPSAQTGITLASSGGNETRPLNVAVYWIIRAK